MNKKLAVIDDFIKQTNSSKELRIKLREAIRYSTQAEGFSWKNNQDIFNELPLKLRYKVTMVMHQQAAERIYYFYDKDPMFITTIIPLLCPMFLKPNDYAYVKGDLAEDIFFISKGKVSFVCQEKNLVFCSFVSGAYFGDFEILFKIKRKYTAVAAYPTNLLVLDSNAIQVIKNEFPLAWKALASDGKNRDSLLDIALDKCDQLLLMKNDENFGDKGHFEIKEILNNMINQEYEKIKFSKHGSVDKQSNIDEIIGTLDSFDKEIQNLDVEANSIYEKVKYISDSL